MGGCAQRQQQREPEAAAPGRPEDLVGDADRRWHTELAGRAFADGLLEVDELEQLLDGVLRARTVGDLDTATGLLPAAWLAAARRSTTAARRAADRRAAHRAEVRSYLAVITLLVGIWLVVAVSAGATHFWPIWPALGWGIPLWLGRPRADRREGAGTSRHGHAGTA